MQAGEAKCWDRRRCLGWLGRCGEGRPGRSEKYKKRASPPAAAVSEALFRILFPAHPVHRLVGPAEAAAVSRAVVLFLVPQCLARCGPRPPIGSCAARVVDRPNRTRKIG